MLVSRSLLIIDGDSAFRAGAARYFRERGYTVREVDSIALGREEVARMRPSFVLVDLGLKSTGGDVVEQLVASPEKPKVVCVAARARVPDVVAAVKAGALDVFERPLDGERLHRLLERHVKGAPVAPASAPAPKPNGHTLSGYEALPIDPLVGDCPRLRDAIAAVDRAAGTEATLVLAGAPGLGQEAYARRFHKVGPRAEGPFVVVRADASVAKVEDALFGASGTLSAFAQAKGGVVYVESTAALGDSGQERLYKLLQGLSSARGNGAPVRWPPMVLGVEGPLEVEVAAGRIRADLAGLVGHTTVNVPSLAERRDDLPELVRRIAVAISRSSGAATFELDPAVIDILVGREYAANLPELVAEVRRVAVVEDGQRFRLDLGAAIAPPPPVKEPTPVVAPAPVFSAPDLSSGWSPTLDASGQVQPYDVYEAEIFRFALKNAGGCVSRAAELLGVGRATMYRKMRAYEIDVPPVSERAVTRHRRPGKLEDGGEESSRW